MKMQYRKFGKDFDVSLLSMGNMRLPCKGDEVDYDAAIDLIRYAIDSGINYVDTAYFYHGEHSERCVGRALKDGYRAKVKLADKLPPWECNTKADMERIFNTQLERLGVDYIDYYLLHGLDKNNWARVKEWDMIAFMEKLKSKGLIKHIGFSFHCELLLFKEIIDAYPWALSMIQYNLIDVDFQAGLEGLRYSYDRGIPVVIMEPLKGSALVNPPPAVKEVYPPEATGMSYVEAALKFLADQKEVGTILSGMSSRAQVDQNLKAVNSTPAGSLTPKQREAIRGMQEIYSKISNIPCSACKYCLPCPKGVAIDKIFAIYNSAYGFGGYGNHRFEYRMLKEKGADVSKCNACGKCTKLCPQGIDVVAKLKDAHNVLG